MTARHPVHYSFGEYIAHDAASSTKHEYLDGQIYAMAGGTPQHSALIASVTTHLSNQVRGSSCRVHSSDLRIRVPETGLATYPDVAVVCGPWERDPNDAHTIINPRVLVEVLSPSTETYDRGEKLEHYKRIPTLAAYLLVAHDRRAFELWTRGPDGAWSSTTALAGESVAISTIGAHLDVDAIYDDAGEPDS
ncbi:MAG: Uma2 family endonuclease [Myxococcales bacterium]|nr:Uma2 family endonuclease [Myxococcales bacterium]